MCMGLCTLSRARHAHGRAQARAVVGLRTAKDDKTLRDLGAVRTVADWREITPAVLRELAGEEALEEAPPADTAAHTVLTATS